MKNLSKSEILKLVDREFTILDLLEDSDILFSLTDSKGYFVSVNSYWEKLTNFTKNELCSKPFMYFLHPDDVKRTMKKYYEGEIFNHAAEATKAFINRYKKKNGGYLDLVWFSTGRTINGLNLAFAVELAPIKEQIEALSNE